MVKDSWVLLRKPDFVLRALDSVQRLFASFT